MCVVASSVMTQPPVMISRRPSASSFLTTRRLVGCALQQWNKRLRILYKRVSDYRVKVAPQYSHSVNRDRASVLSGNALDLYEGDVLSNLGRYINYLQQDFHGFLTSFTRPRPLPSKPFPIQCSYIALPTVYIYIIWFVRLLALRPLLAYCASLG
jgi:hypothetical protein